MTECIHPRRLTTAIVCLLAVAPLAATAHAAGRTVEITADTPAQEVNTYYSMLAHGPTQKFYRLPAAGIVVVVGSGDTKPNASATIHVFPETATAEGIDKWINNCHSDAIFADAAEPERSIPVSAERFHATVSKPLEHVVGPNGDEYDRVRIDFTIDAFEESGVTVKSSRGSLDAFLRTKDLPKP